MAEKKVAKKTAKKSTEKKVTKAKVTKAKVTKAKVTKTKVTKSKAKSKKPNEAPSEDLGIVIVDDDIEIDQEKVNEERRAYLEEARSQEAFD